MRSSTAIGAIVTGVVLIVVAVTKAHEGAWLIILLIPAQRVVLPRDAAALRHGVGPAVAQGLDSRRASAPTPSSCRSAAFSVRWSGALDYAKTLVDGRPRHLRQHGSGGDRALEIAVGGMGRGRAAGGARLALPFADGAAARVRRAVELSSPGDYVTVVLPEFVPARWWHHLFHNQNALLIKGALLFKPHTVVTSVPFHLQE